MEPADGTDDALPPPVGLQVAWEALMREMVRMLRGEAEQRPLVDRLGDELVVPLNLDTLAVIEGFFDLDVGVVKQSPEIAYVLRDCFEQKREEGAEAGEGAE